MESQTVRRLLAELHEPAWRWAVSVCRGDREQAHDVLHQDYVAILESKAIWHQRSSFKT